jgi:hypothetical protein
MIKNSKYLISLLENAKDDVNTFISIRQNTKIFAKNLIYSYKFTQDVEKLQLYSHEIFV